MWACQSVSQGGFYFGRKSSKRRGHHPKKDGDAQRENLYLLGSPRYNWPSPGTGKQVQISITGKTQKEVREKMQAATVAVDNGTYIQPERMTVGEWLDIWTAEYLGGVKPNTVRIYRNNVKRHIKPALGAVRLPELRPHMIQAFINRLELAPASVRLAYKVLYQALKKAVTLHYIPQNPAEGCTLPRLEQEEIKPMDDKQITALLNAARGTEVEQLITTALFTGCRLSELLGLTWDCVGRDTITISKQLARPDQRVDGPFISPKNGKSRTLTARLALGAWTRSRRKSACRLRPESKRGRSGTMPIIWYLPRRRVRRSTNGGQKRPLNLFLLLPNCPASAFTTSGTPML